MINNDFNRRVPLLLTHAAAYTNVGCVPKLSATAKQTNAEVTMALVVLQETQTYATAITDVLEIQAIGLLTESHFTKTTT